MSTNSRHVLSYYFKLNLPPLLHVYSTQNEEKIEKWYNFFSVWYLINRSTRKSSLCVPLLYDCKTILLSFELIRNFFFIFFYSLFLLEYLWVDCVCVWVCVCECLCVGFPYLWFVFFVWLNGSMIFCFFFYIYILFLFTQSFVCFCHQNHINIYIIYMKKNDTSLPFDLPSQTFYLFITVCSLSFQFIFILFFLHYILTFHFLCQDIEKKRNLNYFHPKKDSQI